jgi:hypothetical protein
MDASKAAQASLTSADNASAIEVELLQLQLEQAQEELDAAYERLAQGALPGSGRRADAHADTLSVLDTVEVPPHRHLHVDLRNVRLGARRWNHLDVRLLEHHGRPGLAYFSRGANDEPLSVWRPSGNENGREFMIIVPDDDAARSVLTEMGSSDWRTVDGTIELLVQHLRLTQDERSKRWLTVALRLQSALDAQPRRLRHDHVHVQADSAAPGWMCVTFGNVDFEGRALGDVLWHWHPAHDRLNWIAPASGCAVALAGWPVDGDGTLHPALTLPLGHQASMRERRQWWSTLPAREQTLVLALLDALTRWAEHAPPAVARNGAVLQAASVLRRETRRSALRDVLRSSARRVLGRTAPVTR